MLLWENISWKIHGSKIYTLHIKILATEIKISAPDGWGEIACRVVYMLMRVQVWMHTGNREAGGREYAGGWLRKKLEAAIFAVHGRSYAIRQG